jgi:hypothetical protein
MAHNTTPFPDLLIIPRADGHLSIGSVMLPDEISLLRACFARVRSGARRPKDTLPCYSQLILSA